jgi:ribosomal protein L29
MKIRMLGLAVLVLVGGSGALAVLRAAEPAAVPEKKPTYEDLQKMTPEERRAKIKELREKRAEGLTPEQKELRRKLVRERVEKRIGELQKKKADGTLSEAENRQLELWQQRLKRLEAAEKEAAPAKPGDKPADQPVK